MKGSSVFQNISKRMASLWKGCVNLSCSQVGRDKLSLHELSNGILVYSQAERQSPPDKSLMVTGRKLFLCWGWEGWYGARWGARLYRSLQKGAGNLNIKRLIKKNYNWEGF